MPDLDLEKTRPSAMNTGTSPSRTVHCRLSWPNQTIFRRRDIPFSMAK
jgi:hypothetical protein